MKKTVLSLVAMFCVQSANALTLEQKQDVQTQLELARSEISAVSSLIPKILRKSIGNNLENADKRIAYVQGVFASLTTGPVFFCSMSGKYPNRAVSRMQARDLTMQECIQNQSFCSTSSIQCEQEQ